MKIGVMSDSHDHIPNVNAALDAFRDKGVEHVIHAGDICAPFAFLPFKNKEMPFDAVFGNNDGEWLLLVKLAEGIGRVQKGPVSLKLGGREIALMHEPVFVDALADSGHFDLVVYGHSHDLERRERGRALVLNPGETCGYLRGKSTVMVADLDDMTVETIELRAGS